MPLGTVDIRKFGGVRLGVDPGDVTMEAAVTASNVELAVDRSFVRARNGLVRRGAVSSMSGTVRNSITLGLGYETLLMNYDGARVWLYRADPSSGPTYESDWAATVPGHPNAARLGTPTGTYIYIASGAVMRRYSPGATSSTLGSPWFVGVMPKSNRLVQAAFSAAANSPTGANGTQSTVFFSDAGLPETYSANNYVHLRPGDGEYITGVVSWREQLFVFKQTSVFIFYGESTSSTGSPIFDYRVMDLPGRIEGPNSQTPGPFVGANKDGVFFMSSSGVYKTTGGPPVTVSELINDLFLTRTIRPFTLGVMTNKLSVSGYGLPYVYALDLRNGQWVKWSTVAGSVTAPLASIPEGGATDPSEDIWWAVGSTLYYSHRAASTDDGGAIVSAYQTGHSDLGSAGIKTVKRIQIWGIGNVNVSTAVDYGSLGTAVAVALGVSPATDTGYDTRASARGVYTSIGLGASSGAWQVDGVTLQVRRPRTVGSKT